MKLPVGRQHISCVKGRSRLITINLKDEGGGERFITTGERLIFAVKKHPEDTKPVIYKILRRANYSDAWGAYVLMLTAADTALAVGTYYYDITLESSGHYWPVVECSEFEVNYGVMQPGEVS